MSAGPSCASASRKASTVCCGEAPIAICATYTFPYATAISPRSFLRPRLPAAANFATARARRRLRRLAAGVRVHLGVEHEDAHAAARREHVVEAAVADVVRPAVAADDPHALAHEVIGERLQLLGARVVHPLQRLIQRRDPAPLRIHLVLRDLRRLEDLGDARGAQLRLEGLQQLHRLLGVLVERQPVAEAELRVVFEQGVRPCRPAALLVGRPGRRRAGCRRRWTSSRWRSPRAADRRRAA